MQDEGIFFRDGEPITPEGQKFIRIRRGLTTMVRKLGPRGPANIEMFGKLGKKSERYKRAVMQAVMDYEEVERDHVDDANWFYTSFEFRGRKIFLKISCTRLNRIDYSETPWDFENCHWFMTICYEEDY